MADKGKATMDLNTVTESVAPPSQELVNPSGVGSASELVMKKRRGRPRKSDVAAMSLVVPPGSGVSLMSVSQAVPEIHPGFMLSPSAPNNSANRTWGAPNNSANRTWGRSRGLPPSSENLDFLASLDNAPGDFRAHVIDVRTGEDVIGRIMAPSQNGPRGICILSANGTVSNVVLRQPGSSGGVISYVGHFEILSLNGSFTNSEFGGVGSRSGGFSVSLAAPDGHMIGGGVAGPLTAASPVKVVVGRFMPRAY